MKIKYLFYLLSFSFFISSYTYSQQLRIGSTRIEKEKDDISVLLALQNISIDDSLVNISNNWIEEKHCNLDVFISDKSLYPYVVLYSPESKAHGDIEREFSLSAFHNFIIIPPMDSLRINFKINIKECASTDSLNMMVSLPYCLSQIFAQYRTGNYLSEVGKNASVNLISPESIKDAALDETVSLSHIFDSAVNFTSVIHLK